MKIHLSTIFTIATLVIVFTASRLDPQLAEATCWFFGLALATAYLSGLFSRSHTK